MKERIDYDILKDSLGQPYCVVMPYDSFLELNKKADSDSSISIPHEVVKLHVLENKPLVRAWREHLGKTQTEVAESMGIKQASFSQMENNPKSLRPSTLKRIADAMGIEWEQLSED
ncbi:helix-turn-helix domain-containing protein [Desulfovibrio sp. JC010]|uniref:helix-turn-helix domain-containing protein n=1 Tax=Desulfovibrio sp. JC010 TaxID=2593641 RepID=UPI0013D735F8|nr:helix-turn-helix transcriptional regulator [Desulfovibrio sp. JC010]NDV28850.1 helix-turn-helix transcriptional regulator [Desulfovibrio sp. JC010]